MATQQPPARKFGEYHEIALLGQGGFAQVYLVKDDLGRQWALKQIHEALIKHDPKILERFEREARIQVGLKHPHIAGVHAFNSRERYLVIEYIQGKTLSSLINNDYRNGMDFDMVLAILQPLEEALTYLHTIAQCAHLDISPKNILIRETQMHREKMEQRVVLADFGLARIIDSDGWAEIRTIAGTPYYWAPEQQKLVKDRPGRRSDIYSLGIVIGVMLTGLSGKDVLDILRGKSNTPAPRLTPEVIQVLRQATNEDPNQRYATVKGLVTAFEQAVKATEKRIRAVEVKESFPDPINPSSSKRHIWVRAGAHILTSLITIMLTLIITFGVLLSRIVLPPAAVSSPQSSKISNIIKIGVDLPLSGVDAHDGQPVLNGIRLAVAQAQSSIPGYTLQLDVHDDVGANDTHDPNIGAQNVGIMTNDAQVAGILGPFNSDVAQKELALTYEAQIAQIAASTTSACLTAGGPPTICQQTPAEQHPTTGQVNFFRTSATADAEGSKFADYLTRALHYTFAALINDPGPYGGDFAQAFAAQWRSDTHTTPTQITLPPTTDEGEYAKIIGQIAALKPLPDVIFYAGETPNATLIHTLMELNPLLKGTAFAVGGGVMNASFFTNIDGLQSGPVYAVSPVGDIFSPNSTDGLGFYTDYIASYDAPPTIYAASAYDCTRILIQAIIQAIGSNSLPPTTPNDMSRAKTFRQAVIANILQKTNLDGVTGHYSFSNGSGNPDNGGTITMYQFNSTMQQWAYISTL